MRWLLLLLAAVAAGCQAPIEVRTAPQPPPSDLTVKFNVYDEYTEFIPNLAVLMTMDGKTSVCEYDYTAVCIVPRYGDAGDFTFLAPGFVPRYLVAEHLRPYLGAVRMYHLPYPTFDPTLKHKELL